MGIVLIILAVVAGILSLICNIIILIDAFNDELWKGLVAFFIGLYFLYYAIIEFEHDNKWLVVLGSLGGGAAAALLFLMGTSMMAA